MNERMSKSAKLSRAEEVAHVIYLPRKMEIWKLQPEDDTESAGSAGNLNSQFSIRRKRHPTTSSS